ncbi:MAG: hypothetical protein HFK07_01570 [Clostridia bacterium]|jgi:hypothetical protein|nr:hypothetical protein [Clostridia bacterium]
MESIAKKSPKIMINNVIVLICMLVLGVLIAVSKLNNYLILLPAAIAVIALAVIIEYAFTPDSAIDYKEDDKTLVINRSFKREDIIYIRDILGVTYSISSRKSGDGVLLIEIKDSKAKMLNSVRSVKEVRDRIFKLREEYGTLNEFIKE